MAPLVSHLIQSTTPDSPVAAAVGHRELFFEKNNFSQGIRARGQGSTNCYAAAVIMQ